jgi:hypothetical protein
MKFQSWNRVGLAMKPTGPLPPDFPDFVASQLGHVMMVTIYARYRFPSNNTKRVMLFRSYRFGWGGWDDPNCAHRSPRSLHHLIPAREQPVCP